MGRDDRFRPPEKTDAPKEPEKEAPYVVVEIGAGEEPLPAVIGLTNSYRKRIRENPNMHYIAVDSDAERLKRGREKLSMMDQIRHFDPDERISFIKQERERLDFKSGSVAEIVLRNVLGDIDVEEKTKQDVIVEAARVLKPAGILRIIEQISPRAQGEILSMVNDVCGNTFSIMDTATVPEEDRAFDEQMLELQLHPSAFVMRLVKKTAE